MSSRSSRVSASGSSTGDPEFAIVITPRLSGRPRTIRQTRGGTAPRPARGRRRVRGGRATARMRPGGAANFVRTTRGPRPLPRDRPEGQEPAGLRGPARRQPRTGPRPDSASRRCGPRACWSACASHPMRTGDAVRERAARVFGVVKLSRAERVDPTYEAVAACVGRLADAHAFPTFRISANRADKTFPLTSHELNVRLGDLVRRTSGAAVGPLEARARRPRGGPARRCVRLPPRPIPARADCRWGRPGRSRC